MEKQFPNGWSCQGKDCNAKMPSVGPCDGGLNKYCAECAVSQEEVDDVTKDKLNGTMENIQRLMLFLQNSSA